MLEESESIDYAFEVAAGYIRRALGAIEPLPASAAKGCLTAMAEFVLGRRQ
jgi:geranylgeranyl pyrophosphate synthase